MPAGIHAACQLEHSLVPRARLTCWRKSLATPRNLATAVTQASEAAHVDGQLEAHDNEGDDGADREAVAHDVEEVEDASEQQHHEEELLWCRARKLKRYHPEELPLAVVTG